MTTTLLHRAVHPPAGPVRGATIVDLFRERARARPADVALRHHDGAAWQPITWRSYERAVAETAAARVCFVEDARQLAKVLLRRVG